MTVESPAGVVKGVSTPAEVQRHAHQALAGASVGAFAGGIGAVGMAHGICYPAAFAVSQSGTPGMSVDVAAGTAFSTGTVSAAQGPYSLYSPSTITKSVAPAHATLARKDLVVVRPLDPEFSGTPGVYTPDVFVVTGEPAASPADPSLASHPNAVVLARVNVAAAATSITNANIDDLRLPARASAWYQSWGKIGSATITTPSAAVTTIADVTGLSVTWDAVAGRSYKVSVSGLIQSSVVNDRVVGYIRNAANTKLGRWAQHNFSAAYAIAQSGFVELTGLTGSQTVKVSLERESGSGLSLIAAGGEFPCMILVEDAGSA